MEVADEELCPFFGGALGGGKADAGAGRGGDDHGLALEHAERGRIGGHRRSRGHAASFMMIWARASRCWSGVPSQLAQALARLK